VLSLLEAAVRLGPAMEKPRIALAWALATAPDATLRDPARARTLAEESVARTGRKDIAALNTLGAAEAAAGDYAKAVEATTAAIALARASHQDSLARTLEPQLALYRSGRPYVETAAAR